MIVAVTGTVCEIFPTGQDSAQIIVNVGQNVVYVDSRNSVNAASTPLNPGANTVWDAGRPLYAISPGGSSLNIGSNSGAISDPSTLAGQIAIDLTASGLAADIATEMVASPLAGNIASQTAVNLVASALDTNIATKTAAQIVASGLATNIANLAAAQIAVSGAPPINKSSVLTPGFPAFTTSVNYLSLGTFDVSDYNSVVLRFNSQVGTTLYDRSFLVQLTWYERSSVNGSLYAIRQEQVQSYYTALNSDFLFESPCYGSQVEVEVKGIGTVTAQSWTWSLTGSTRTILDSSFQPYTGAANGGLLLGSYNASVPASSTVVLPLLPWSGRIGVQMFGAAGLSFGFKMAHATPPALASISGPVPAPNYYEFILPRIQTRVDIANSNATATAASCVVIGLDP